MEVIDIITHYIDKHQNIINVEFRMLGDDENTTREDLIEYSFFEEYLLFPKWFTVIELFSVSFAN